MTCVCLCNDWFMLFWHVFERQLMCVDSWRVLIYCYLLLLCNMYVTLRLSIKHYLLTYLLTYLLIRTFQQYRTLCYKYITSVHH